MTSFSRNFHSYCDIIKCRRRVSNFDVFLKDPQLYAECYSNMQVFRYRVLSRLRFEHTTPCLRAIHIRILNAINNLQHFSIFLKKRVKSSEPDKIKSSFSKFDIDMHVIVNTENGGLDVKIRKQGYTFNLDYLFN